MTNVVYSHQPLRAPHGVIGSATHNPRCHDIAGPYVLHFQSVLAKARTRSRSEMMPTMRVPILQTGIVRKRDFARQRQRTGPAGRKTGFLPAFYATIICLHYRSGQAKLSS